MLRLLLHCFVMLLPWWAKNPIYRHLCGYEIGRRVRIGFSPIVATICRIGDDTSIGHLNLFLGTKEVVIEDHVSIGHVNLFRGGDLIHLQRYSQFLRTNVINAIVEPDVANPITSEFRLGPGSVVTTGHWIDFTDKVTIGCRSIVGGRHSSIWTHNRQWTRPISIGDFVYMGSDISMAPGTSIPSYCIVALGSVIINSIPNGNCLVAGNPAQPLKTLSERKLRLLRRKTRNDLPDDVGLEDAPEVSELTCREQVI